MRQHPAVAYRGYAARQEITGTMTETGHMVSRPACGDHLRLRQGSGYEQAEAEFCRVEVGEVAVALGPPA